MSTITTRIALMSALGIWILCAAARMTAQEGPPQQPAHAARHEWRLRADPAVGPAQHALRGRCDRFVKAGGPVFFARLDRVGPRWLWCEAVALNNGAFLAGTDMDPNVCQKCHSSFPADNTALVGSLNHCDIVQ